MYNRSALNVKPNWKDLTSRISAFQNEEKFTDIDLLVDNQIFRGHKVILASASPYFETMFSCQLSEKNQTTIQIHGLKREVFQILFDYIYHRDFKIDDDNVQEILGGSNLLQLNNLTKNCCEFLKTKLNEKNAVCIYRLADVYSSTESLLSLKRDCKFFIEKNFLKIIKNEDFIDLPFHLFENLIKSESLDIHSELDVLKATLRWISKDIHNRLKHVNPLMRHVRLAIIPKAKMENIIQNLKSKDLKTILQEIIYQNLQTENITILKKPRYKNSCIFYLIGGLLEKPEQYSQFKVASKITRIDACNFKITFLGQLKVARFNHQSVEMNGLLYIAGGISKTEKNLNLVEIFDLYENKKVNLSFMLNSRQDFGLINYNDCLLAIGGSDKYPTSIERYDPKTNQWFHFDSISELPVKGFRTLKVENYIYIIGGSSKSNELLDQMLRYDPKTKQVKRLSSMKEKRQSFGCVYAFGHIYVIGGSSPLERNKTKAERYSLIDDQWTSISDLQKAVENCCVTVALNKLLVVGGQEPISRNLSSRVHFYDPEQNLWTNHKDLPFQISHASLISIADQKF